MTPHGVLSPRLALHAASPVPPSSVDDLPHMGSAEEPRHKASRNSLFDQDWGTLAPAPPRSRSSTVESQFSQASSGTGGSTAASTTASSVRRSWMDVECSPPLQSTIPAVTGPVSSLWPPKPVLERADTSHLRLDITPVPGAKEESGFVWPITPPSPPAKVRQPLLSMSSIGGSPPFVAVDGPVGDASASPPTPSIASTASPPMSSPPLSSFPPRISASSSNSSDPLAPLPPTAGHSANPLLDTRRSPSLRMSPTPPYLLGEGRHATVYLASFTPAPDQPWQLCAAKRLAPDRESQISGLGEAFILARLAGVTTSASVNSAHERRGGSRFILGLYGVRDERDGVDPPLALLSSSVSGSASVSRRASAAGVGESPSSSSPKRWSMGSTGSPRDGEGASVPSSPLGKTFPDVTDRFDMSLSPGERRRPASLKLPSPHHGDLNTGSPPASSTRRKGPRHSDLSQLGHGHSRLSLLSHALEPPLASSKRRITLSGAATAGPGTPASPTSSQPTGLAPALPISAASLGQAVGPIPSRIPVPRIDLLLEYCPRGHVLQFARNHPELVDKARWLDWAGQLASAVAWAHDKGVLHADIKPQNVLVAPDTSLRLSDWGTSLFLPPASSPRHRFPTDPHGLGTPSYSPPEFVQPLPSTFSYPSDIFSLALTLGTLLTGREPYDGLRAVERMLRVASGGWWEWEERKRLREEGDEAEVALSRAGSVRSTRSATSRRTGGGGRTRSDSVESVKSVVSNAPDAYGYSSGPRDWDAIKMSLLDVEDGDHRTHKELGPDGTARRSLGSSVSLASSSQPPSPSSDEGMGSNEHPPSRTYPGTSIPVQYFLSGTTCLATDLVPLGVRDLLQRMASPAPEQRPSAQEVVVELRRLAHEEGVEVAW